MFFFFFSRPFFFFFFNRFFRFFLNNINFGFQQCDCDYIVRYYDNFFKKDEIWIVMEYCSQGSLTDMLTARKKVFSEVKERTKAPITNFFQKQSLLLLVVLPPFFVVSSICMRKRRFIATSSRKTFWSAMPAFQSSPISALPVSSVAIERALIR